MDKRESALKAQAGLIELQYLASAELWPGDRKIIQAAIDLCDRWSRNV